MEHMLKIVRWFKRPKKSVLAQYIEAFIVILPIAFFIRTFLYGLYQVPSGSMEPTMLIGERFLADKFSVWFSSPKRGDIISFNDPTYEYSKNKLISTIERYVWLPWGPDNWTKRVIAIPGDHVKGVIEDGKPTVYLNGKKLNEPYVNKYPLLATLSGKSGWTRKTYNPKMKIEEQIFYRFNPFEVYAAKRFIESRGEPAILYPSTPIPDGSEGSDVFEYKLGFNEYFCMGDNRLGSHDSRGWGLLNGRDIHGKIIFRLWSHDGDASFWILDLLLHPVDFWRRMRWGRCLQCIK